MELVHPFHEHPLKTIVEEIQKNEEQHYICSGCTIPILSGSIFTCSKQCGFTLHKSCAELAKEITHILHPDHPLVLHGESPQEDGVTVSCGHCNNTIEGFVYRCSICQYDLDISCASMSVQEVDMEVVHPFHEHPLMPGEQKYDDKQLMCSGCTAPILPGPFFICNKKECKFVLHQSCVELPLEIRHSLHARHPLVLHAESPYADTTTNWCDHCGDRTERFVYHCSICDFDLDVVCASLKNRFIEEEEEEEDHEHKFMLLKPTQFSCDVCGNESKGKSYVCFTCQAQVHPICSSLPSRVKLFTHSCPLDLTFGYQLEKPIDSIKQSCRACFQKLVDTKYGFYYCIECEYIADIQCSTDKRYRDYQFDAESNMAASVNYKDVGKIDLETWHAHGLILCNDESTTADRQVVCRGCVSIISSAPFYECKEKCGYNLHESCANLYEKIRHPFHDDHDLVLLDRRTFRCQLCELPCSGFGYYCKQEGRRSFVYDVKCAMRSTVIHIDKAHQHPLRIIAEGDHNDKNCNGCSLGCDRTRYSCPDCDFNLCDRCVGLPASVKHSWDEHPLELTYRSIPQECGEYYCDQCEEPRDLKHWFYHCAVCERDVHTKCMGLHNLDLTKTYKLKNHPGHDLILVANPQVYPICTKCGFPCKDLYYQCLDCKHCLHYVWCNQPE